MDVSMLALLLRQLRDSADHETFERIEQEARKTQGEIARRLDAAESEIDTEEKKSGTDGATTQTSFNLPSAVRQWHPPLPKPIRTSTYASSEPPYNR